jgi:hypothetical protein
MSTPRRLLSTSMKLAVERLSHRTAINIKRMNRFGDKPNHKTKNYTIGDMKVMVRTGMARKDVLKRTHINGSDMCAWMMDRPITKFYEPRVAALGTVLGVSDPIDYFEEE